MMVNRVIMSALACAAILCACAGGCSRVALPESARYELHLDFVRPDGTVVKTTILPAQTEEYPKVAVCPNGERIVLSTTHDTYFLDGTSRVRAYHNGKEAKEILLRPSFSPKGRQVAFFWAREPAGKEGTWVTGVAFFTPGGRRISCVPVPAKVVAPKLQTELLELKTVEAEFAGLPGHSVAVVVHADETALLKGPAVEEDLARLIGAELRTRVADVRVIQPAKIRRYQREHPEWPSRPLTRMGKRLGADYVLDVRVLEYSWLEPGGSALLHGRLRARASLWDVSAEKGKARVWQRDSIRATHPPDGLIFRSDPDTKAILLLLRKASQQLAETLVRSFYRHTAPVWIDDDPKDPSPPPESR